MDEFGQGQDDHPSAAPVRCTIVHAGLSPSGEGLGQSVNGIFVVAVPVGAIRLAGHGFHLVVLYSSSVLILHGAP